MTGNVRIGLGLALLAGAAWVGFTLLGDASRGEPGGATAVDWLEIPAPDVAFETLDGSETSLSAYRGQVVLLNFWGTWCPPCRREIPELVALQSVLGEGGGTVIGVAIASGSPEEIRAFTEDFGVNYPIWISDAGTALSNYDAVGYPFTLLIDGTGMVRKQYLGPQSYETLAEDVERLTGRELPPSPAD